MKSTVFVSDFPQFALLNVEAEDDEQEEAVEDQTNSVFELFEDSTAGENSSTTTSEAEMATSEVTMAENVSKTNTAAPTAATMNTHTATTTTHITTTTTPLTTKSATETTTKTTMKTSTETKTKTTTKTTQSPTSASTVNIGTSTEKDSDSQNVARSLKNNGNVPSLSKLFIFLVFCLYMSF